MRDYSFALHEIRMFLIRGAHLDQSPYSTARHEIGYNFRPVDERERLSFEQLIVAEMQRFTEEVRHLYTTPSPVSSASERRFIYKEINDIYETLDQTQERAYSYTIPYKCFAHEAVRARLMHFYRRYHGESEQFFDLLNLPPDTYDEEEMPNVGTDAQPAKVPKQKSKSRAPKTQTPRDLCDLRRSLKRTRDPDPDADAPATAKRSRCESTNDAAPDAQAILSPSLDPVPFPPVPVADEVTVERSQTFVFPPGFTVESFPMGDFSEQAGDLALCELEASGWLEPTHTSSTCCPEMPPNPVERVGDGKTDQPEGAIPSPLRPSLLPPRVPQPPSPQPSQPERPLHWEFLKSDNRVATAHWVRPSSRQPASFAALLGAI